MTAPAGNDNGDTDESNDGEGFAAITSQEQFDKTFNQRWSREQAKLHEQYKGFDELKAKAEQFDQLQAAKQTESERLQAERDTALQAAKDNDTRATAAELAALRQRVAIEENLPIKFAAKLSGTTEDELRADAKDTFGEFITTPSFDHGPRSQSAPQSMNDMIFGAAKRR
jgi:hypothetical protein